jgi:hypothetical protein
MLGVAVASGVLLQLAAHLCLLKKRTNTTQTLVLTSTGYRYQPEWLESRALKPLDHLVENGFPPVGLFFASWGMLAADWFIGEPSVERFSIQRPCWVLGCCWGFQSLLTILPIPYSAGRGLLIALFMHQGHLNRVPDDEILAERWANRVQTVLAILLLVLSLAYPLDRGWGNSLPLWPFVAMLGVLVWMQRSPVTPGSPSHGEVLGEKGRGTWATRWSGLVADIQQWQRRRQLRQLALVEMQEAEDAEKLDGVLEKLQRVGMNKMSHGERQLLQRVSRRLQTDRENRK